MNFPNLPSWALLLLVLTPMTQTTPVSVWNHFVCVFWAKFTPHPPHPPCFPLPPSPFISLESTHHISKQIPGAFTHGLAFWGLPNIIKPPWQPEDNVLFFSCELMWNLENIFVFAAFSFCCVSLKLSTLRNDGNGYAPSHWLISWCVPCVLTPPSQTLHNMTWGSFFFLNVWWILLEVSWYILHKLICWGLLN